jgi:hypothetical protein
LLNQPEYAGEPMKPLIEVFFQPGKVFSGLQERSAGGSFPAWLVPLLANTILLLVSVAITVNVLGMDLIMRQRLASSNMSPAQMQQALERAASPVGTYITYAAVGLGTPLAMLVVAGILFAFGLMTSRAPGFGVMLAMVNLAFFPYFAVTVLMTAIVMIAAPDKTALDINNILATNVAAFVNKSETSKGLYALFNSLDVLSFIEIGLLSYGFSKITRAGFAAGLGAVGGMWILYVLSKMALSLFQ